MRLILFDMRHGEGGDYFSNGDIDKKTKRVRCQKIKISEQQHANDSEEQTTSFNSLGHFQCAMATMSLIVLEMKRKVMSPEMQLFSSIGYNRPTLCTDCYSFIYYSGSYMFRHLCAIFRKCPLSLWVTWKSEMDALSWTKQRTKLQHPVHTGHQHLQYRGTSRWHNHFELSSKSHE
jgi:hypothetical protein